MPALSHSCSAPARRGVVLLLTVSVVALLVILATVFLAQVMGHATSGVHAKRRVIANDLTDHALAHARAVLDRAAVDPETYTTGGTTWNYHSRRGVPIQGFYADGGADDVDRFEQIWYHVLSSQGPSYDALVDPTKAAGSSLPLRNFGDLAGWGIDMDRINQQLNASNSLERYYGGENLGEFRYFDAELQPVTNLADAFWVGKYSVMIIDQHSLPRVTPDLASSSHAITGTVRHQHVNYYARSWASALGAFGNNTARELNPRADQGPGWGAVGWIHPVLGGSYMGTSVHPWDHNPLLAAVSVFRGTGRFQRVSGRPNGFGRWDTTLGPIAGIAGPVLTPYQLYAAMDISVAAISHATQHKYAISAPGIVDPGMELEGCPWRYHLLTVAPKTLADTVLGLSSQVQFMDITGGDVYRLGLHSDLTSSLEVLADEDFVAVEHAVAQEVVGAGTPEREAYANELRSRWGWSGSLGAASNTAIDPMAADPDQIELRRWQFENMVSHHDLLFAPTGRFEPEIVYDVEAKVGSGSAGHWARLDLNDPYHGKVRGHWAGKKYAGYFPVDLHPYHLWAQGGSYASDVLDDDGNAGGDTINDAPASTGFTMAPDIGADGGVGGTAFFAFNTPDKRALASANFDGFRYPVYSPPWTTGDPRRGDTNGDGTIDASDDTDKPYWTGMEGRRCKLWPPRQWDYASFGPMPAQQMRIVRDNEWPMAPDSNPKNDAWEGWHGLLPYAGYRENLIADITMAYLNAVCVAQINSAAESTPGNRLPPSQWHHTPEEVDRLARRFLIGATDGSLSITGSRTAGLTVAGGGSGSAAEMAVWLASLRTDFINDPSDNSDDVDDSPIYTATAEIVLNDYRMSLLGLPPVDFDGDGTMYGGADVASAETPGATWQPFIELDVDVPFPAPADRGFWGLPGSKWDLTGHDLDRDGVFEPFSATGRLDLFVQNTFRIFVRGRLEPGPVAVSAGLAVPLNPLEGALQPVDVFAEGIYFVEDSDGSGTISDSESHILHLRRRRPTDHR